MKSRVWIRGLLISFLITACLASFGASSEYLKEHGDEIKKALLRRICYDSYWQGENILLRRTVPIETVVEGDRFFVRINDLRVVRGSNMVGFYQGIIRDGKAFVSLVEEWNIRIAPSGPYGKNWKHSGAGRVISNSLLLPNDCTPKYDPSSARKEAMLRTVVNTMKFGLHFMPGQSLPGHPVEFTLTIANFNVDYPYTYVLVEPSREFFRVRLHDFSDSESGEYEKEGQYPYEQIYEKVSQELVQKVREHGIVFKITGTPISGWKGIGCPHYSQIE